MLALNRIGLSPQRALLLGLAVTGLMIVFLFQETDLVALVTGNPAKANINFIVNRVVRLVFNDLFMLLIIVVLFQDNSTNRLAIVIQLIDLLVLLPLYLWIKLGWEGDSEISSPLLSQFHRLIVNPTLMILLIPAVYFQRMMQRR